jgi:DNA-directed RNA polymerase III subunit RPC1
LGEVSSYIEEVFGADDCYLTVKLDLAAIAALQLQITADSVVQSILATKKLKLKVGVQAKTESVIRITPPDAEDSSLLFAFTRLKAALPSVVVQGVSNVNRAVINDVGDGTYNLLVEGYNLLGVMTTLGVKGEECTSNHVDEMCASLGIEAARSTIIREIATTMEGHGMTIDYRHMALLADIMCYRGRVLGITRFGVAQMKESVLMLASFEKTADHLFEAALRGVEDGIAGVSECIIMGTPIPVGTGLFQLMQRVQGNENTARHEQWKRSSLLLHEIDNKKLNI